MNKDVVGAINLDMLLFVCAAFDVLSLLFLLILYMQVVANVIKQKTVNTKLIDELETTFTRSNIAVNSMRMSILIKDTF